jgi:hypothetical protein
MRTVTYKSVIDRIAGYMGEAGGLSGEDATLANAKVNLFVRLAWEHFWWPELMLIEPRELDSASGRDLSLNAPSERRQGILKLASGVGSGSVTGLGLGFTPTAFRMQIARPSGGLNLRAYGNSGTLGPDGFAFELNGVTDNANYELHYEVWGEEGVIPATSSDGSRKTGVALIANGAQSGTVSGLSVGFTPGVVRLQIVRPSGGLNIEAWPTAVSASGFSYELSAVTDSGLYELHYELAEAGPALGPIRQRGAVALPASIDSGRLRNLNIGWEGQAISLQVMRAGGLNINAYPIAGSASHDGFAFELDGITDSAAYQLHWQVARPVASEMGEVRAIWDRDPRGNRYACRVGGGRGPDFRLRAGMMQVLGTVNPVWVEFRRRPNVYTGSLRTATGTYAAGVTVYDTATGDYWTANQAIAAGQSPTTNPEKWDRVEFPYIFAEFVAQSAYAMLTDREQEQPENFSMQLAAGYPLLVAELDKVERQQGQTRQLRVVSSR